MTKSGGEWIPWQYYSGSCGPTYNRRPDEIITRADETKAICIKEFSDISPLTGGSVAFSTLEGRPSAFNFESSEVLQVITGSFLDTFASSADSIKLLDQYIRLLSHLTAEKPNRTPHPGNIWYLKNQ